MAESMSKEKEQLTWQWIDGGVSTPQGFSAAGVMAKVKYPDKYDVAVIYSEVPAKAAGVFTRNKVKAHPLILTKKHLNDGIAQAIAVNSGNANACVGKPGDEAALAMAKSGALALAIKEEDVLVASTGVIGVEMPINQVIDGIEESCSLVLSQDGIDKRLENAHKAALAIMTTDTFSKEVACELKMGKETIRIGAMAKGSGMIHPNMGTMLGFITTDALVPSAKLQELLSEAVDDSFNMVTVDGDTSTNDMVLMLANGKSGIELDGEEWDVFKGMVFAVCQELAQLIARDGEGATKFLEVKVTGAGSKDDARKIAKSICGSSLVKTAIFGEDANWGRILAAAGYSGADFNPENVSIYLGPVLVAQNGQGVEFSEEEAKVVLSQKDILVNIILDEGESESTAWGCDLTHEYVNINADYRT